MQIFLMMNDPPRPKLQSKAHTWHGCVVHDPSFHLKYFWALQGLAGERRELKPPGAVLFVNTF